VFLLAQGVAEFTRDEPSAGSFIEFVESGLGPVAGIATAVLVAVGYMIAMAGVFTMSGGFLALTLAHYGVATVPWGPLTLVITLAALALMVRGIRLSTSAVAAAVVLQVTIMVVACAVILVDHRTGLSGAPSGGRRSPVDWVACPPGSPGPVHVHRWENGPALAEECRNPRRTVPGLMISIAVATVLFLLFAYATVTGFGYDVSSIGRSSIPFLTWPTGPSAPSPSWPGWPHHLRPGHLVSGTTRSPGCSTTAGDGQAPRWLGVVHPTTRTRPGPGGLRGRGPGRDRSVAVVHAAGVGTGSMDPVGSTRVLDPRDGRDPVRLPADDGVATGLRLAPAP